MTCEQWCAILRREANVIAHLLEEFNVQQPLRQKLCWVEARLNAACNEEERERLQAQAEKIKADGLPPV